MKTLFIFLFLLFTVSFSFSQSKNYFKIKVVDEKSGHGVPLVELKTTNNLSYFTDNNGIIAFYEPGLMNQEVFFHIKSHGYEFPADGFGYHGKTLKTIKGDSTVIKIKRINIAERMYRVTGEGLYGNSILVGSSVPIKQPLLNGKVMGQDTFIETLYHGKIYWFWGDTDRPSFPLGNFSTSGATSEIPGKGGLDPAVGVDLNYFVDESGFSKKMCTLPGPGPVWIHWLTTLKDSLGKERMITSYTRIKNLGEAYEQGLAVFNDTAEKFEPFLKLDLNSPFFPDGQSFRAAINGNEYIYFDACGHYPRRVRADLKHIKDLSSYEAYTCLKEGTKYEKDATVLDRGSNGTLLYGWKTNTEPLTTEKEEYLLKKGLMKPEECLAKLRDIQSGNFINLKSGSTYWNEYRKKWVMIFEQIYGTSYMGEVWFAEGDTPTGPWVYARKIVTHDNYTFYNVGQHPIFDQHSGRLIYFEGTYTSSFSGNPVKTPQFDYNQIMYRLDLNDTALYLPSPVYRIADKKTKFRYLMRNGIDFMNNQNTIQEIPFFAFSPDRICDGLIPVYEVNVKGKIRLNTEISENNPMKVKPLFYGLPYNHFTAKHTTPIRKEFLSPMVVPLYEFKDQNGFYSYSVKSVQEGLIRTEKPVCRVWLNPVTNLNFDFDTRSVPFEIIK